MPSGASHAPWTDFDDAGTNRDRVLSVARICTCVQRFMATVSFVLPQTALSQFLLLVTGISRSALLLRVGIVWVEC